MAELVDAHGSGPCAFGCGGSNPLLGTTTLNNSLQRKLVMGSILLHSKRLFMSQNIQFDLTTEYVELCNLLKLVGLADSGGRGKTMVAEGLVEVDGLTEFRKTAKIRSGQTVKASGQTIFIK